MTGSYGGGGHYTMQSYHGTRKKGRPACINSNGLRRTSKPLCDQCQPGRYIHTPLDATVDRRLSWNSPENQKVDVTLPRVSILEAEL